MKITIDAAGRVVIPSQVRSKLGLRPGTELAVEIDDCSVRLVRVAPRPTLVRRGKRLVVRPSVDPKQAPPIDIPSLIEEERNRWPL